MGYVLLPLSPPSQSSWVTKISAVYLLLLASMYLVKLHRIIELFELEQTFKSHLVQLPCTEQGHPQIRQVLRAPYIQTLNDSNGTAIQ